MSAGGLTNGVVAEKVGLRSQSVGKWRTRFLQQGLMGLYDERRLGRPRTGLLLLAGDRSLVELRFSKDNPR